MASAFRTGALAFAGLRLGLLAFAGLLVSVAWNFALFAALRSARVNLRPVCGQ